MTSKGPSCCKNRSMACGSGNQRQHFNYLRNNSSSIYNVFTMQAEDTGAFMDEDCHIDARGYYSQHHNQQQYVQRQTKTAQANNKARKVSFDNTRAQPQTRTKNQKLNLSEVATGLESTQKSASKGQAANKSVLHETHKRPQSASKQRNQEQNEGQSQSQNRRKVKNYVDSMIPYTRDFPNSKFQDYFGKAALETYGRANTNQPAGGIIYGNHLKTFNVNPHCYMNYPKYYQTHTTALNFGKRTKLNEQARWKLLQKQLTKKLGLKDSNATLKAGKEVMYVDVNDANMYEVMRQNHQFTKTHKEEIRDLQNEYKRQKQAEHKAKVEQFYANKKAKIEQNLQKTLNTTQATASAVFADKDQQERLRQQVIYRYHDDKGNVRLAADRHGITCYVDMNFPENSAAYTEELRNRMPIFPIQCKPDDRNIDPIRRQNYIKSLQNVYPSHYLLPNCEQPQILKMLQERAGKAVQNRNTKSPENAQGMRGKSIQNMKKATRTGNNPANFQRSGQNINTQHQNANRGASTVEYQQQNANRGETNTVQYQQKNANRGGTSTVQYQQQKTDYQNSKSNQYKGGNYNQEQKQQASSGNRQYDGGNQGYNGKREIFDKAWANSAMAQEIVRQQNVRCCGTHHLPSNEKQPLNYKYASDKIGQVPIAGKSRD